jgi:murE/murF fusion protein
MSLSLRALLQGLTGLDAEIVATAGDIVVEHLTLDSRRVVPQTLFVAAAGVTAHSRDGHDFVAAAVAAGACAIVCERRQEGVTVPQVVVPHARRAAAVMAERLAQHPSSRLSLVGVTGTNGKTTTTFLLAQIASAAGRSGAVFGTLGIGPPEAPVSSGFTTPEAEVLSARLSELQRGGFDVVSMEVSSHALATHRVDGLSFAAAGFTNLTQDHLDFHGTLAAYFGAKARLFGELLPAGAGAVLPADDDEYGFHAQLRQARPDALTWGVHPRARVKASNVVASPHGVCFRLSFDDRSADVEANALLGSFNVDNALVAAGLALSLGVPLDTVARGLSSAKPPPGRMQRVRGPAGGPLVVVDYAHTPDALERALLSARTFTAGRLFVVFGCGGDRDTTKRPLMGTVASDVADAVVVTDDNPRSEEGSSILAAIAGGIRSSLVQVQDAASFTKGTWLAQGNRRLAVRAAIGAAHEGDVVVIAGKGHERDQTTAGIKVPFDDATEARAALVGASRPAFLPRAFVERTLGGVWPAATAQVFCGVTTDSRAIEPGALFVPLRGERFDGHDWIQQALKAGAAAALVARDHPVAARVDLPLLVVDDPLAALQELARAWLCSLPTTRIGLTGSNGKTTTKELLAAALRACVGNDAVLATEGNLNNHIGVPLTSLRVEAHHRFAILEMGMNHLGEIASYCRYALPQVGLVTNMGTAHAGNVGGVEGVARAKSELLEALPVDGVAIINADDPRCVRDVQRKARCRRISFGSTALADVRVVGVVDLVDGGQRLTLSYRRDQAETTIPLQGRHNALNAAAAVATAVALDLPFATATMGLADVKAARGRLQRRQRADGLMILDDSYNANPDSMEAGLETLKSLPMRGLKMAALGPMLELGEHAPAAHRHIGAAAAQAGIARLFCCGELGRQFAEGARAAGLADVVWAEDSAALALVAQEQLRSDAGDVVLLVKGSRGARMERVVAALLPPDDDGGNEDRH